VSVHTAVPQKQVGNNDCPNRSDYQDIDPRYGTLKDWDNLLHGVHERGMKLM
jgi:hypothetical protein